MLNQKRHGTRLEFRTFTGRDGNDYLVFRNPDGSFHTFVEVEAKEAARECEAEEDDGATTQSMWESLWNRTS
jgi:hypothetical protein